MEIKVHDQIAWVGLVFWMVTKDSDDNKVSIIRAAWQDAGVSEKMNDNFEDSETLDI